MTSTLTFKKHHGNQREQCHFQGEGIRLLDLKKEILSHEVEKGKTTGSLDFDYEIKDENTGTIYVLDDELVPKNSSVVFKRLPVRNNMGLVARLKGGRSAMVMPAYSSQQQTSEINIPMKQKNEPKVIPKIEPPSSVSTQSTSLPDAPNAELPPAVVLIGEASFEHEDENDMASIDAIGREKSLMGGRGGRGMGGRGISGGRGNIGGRGMAVCKRCDQVGHVDKYCPTIGDPNFDPLDQGRISNVPKSIRETVTSLDGIDMTGKTAIQNSDGTWDLIKSSAKGLERLTRDAESFSQAVIDMSEVPGALVCPLSNTILREAVQLPCCGKCCNDGAIRQSLLNSSLVCPLCQKPNVSTDSLTIRKDIRDSVDDYIKSKSRSNDDDKNDTDKSASSKPVNALGPPGWNPNMPPLGLPFPGMPPMIPGMPPMGWNPMMLPLGPGMVPPMPMPGMPMMPGMPGFNPMGYPAIPPMGLPDPTAFLASLAPPLSYADFVKEQEFQREEKKQGRSFDRDRGGRGGRGGRHVDRDGRRRSPERDRSRSRERSPPRGRTGSLPRADDDRGRDRGRDGDRGRGRSRSRDRRDRDDDRFRRDRRRASPSRSRDRGDRKENRGKYGPRPEDNDRGRADRGRSPLRDRDRGRSISPPRGRDRSRDRDRDRGAGKYRPIDRSPDRARSRSRDRDRERDRDRDRDRGRGRDERGRRSVSSSPGGPAHKRGRVDRSNADSRKAQGKDKAPEKPTEQATSKTSSSSTADWEVSILNRLGSGEGGGGGGIVYQEKRQGEKSGGRRRNRGGRR